MWKCTVCGQLFHGDTPPAPCPVCGAGQDTFIRADETASTFRKDTMARFVIIGGGAAGYAAAKAIRVRNATATVKLVCGEGIPPYSRPSLSSFVAGNAVMADMLLMPEAEYAHQCIQLITDAHAVAIDRAKGAVILSDGRRLFYDSLCIATGANAFNPFGDAPGAVPLFPLRAYSDAQNVIAHGMGKRVLIIGSGILGMEAALALHARGASVTMAERGGRILSIQADETVSGRLQQAMEKLGIAFALGASLAARDAQGATLTDGTRVACDCIIASVGIRSETILAREAGLSVNRGIVVNGQMRTTDEDIYAAGDCAEVNGVVAGLWGAALMQGEVAGACMAGDPSAKYTPYVPASALSGPGIDLFAAGNVQGEGLETKVRDAADGSYVKLAFEGGKLCGALLWGDVSMGGKALEAVEQGMDQQAALGLFNF